MPNPVLFAAFLHLSAKRHTPMSPALIKQGWVQAWVTSRWKNPSIPGQISAEINNLCVRLLALSLRRWPCCWQPPYWFREDLWATGGTGRGMIGIIPAGSAVGFISTTVKPKCQDWLRIRQLVTPSRYVPRDSTNDQRCHYPMPTQARR